MTTLRHRARIRLRVPSTALCLLLAGASCGGSRTSSAPRSVDGPAREAQPEARVEAPAPVAGEACPLTGEAGAHLCVLAAPKLRGRVTQSDDARAAATYVAGRLEAAGLRPLPGEQGFVLPATRVHAGEDQVFHNVGAQLSGDGDATEGAIVISAHLDGVGTSRGGAFVAGANDDASGIAVMLALAARLRERPPGVPVWFVAFDGEEIGLVGSALFAEAHAAQLSAARVGLNLEMLGRNDGGGGWWMTGLASSDAEQLFGTDDAPEPVRGRTPDTLFRHSDNYSLFSRACLPAFTLSVGDIAPSHHTPDDDLAGIDGAVLERSVDVAEALVREAVSSARTVTFDGGLQSVLDACRSASPEAG